MSEEIELKDNKLSVKSMRRRCERMSAKTKKKFLIRFMITIISVIGFIYYTTDLLSQYLKRQTVVNIKLEENIKYNNIPSISICFPQMISMESMAQKYEELIPIYEKYKNIMNNSSEEDFKNKAFIKNMNDLYFKNFSYFNKNLTINELFDLSIPFEYQNDFNNKTLYSIDIIIKGIHLNKNKSIISIDLEDRQPIE